MKEAENQVVAEKKEIQTKEIETFAFEKARRTRGALIVKTRGSIYGSSRTKRAKSHIKL